MGSQSELEASKEASEGSSTDLPASGLVTISTAVYISQIAGELAALARAADIHILAYLLARAQIEAELWARGAPAKY
jgi:hypothetical protein